MRKVQIQEALLYPSERYKIEDLIDRLGIEKLLTLIKELHPSDFKDAIKTIGV